MNRPVHGDRPDSADGLFVDPLAELGRMKDGLRTAELTPPSRSPSSTSSSV
ncbi:hypothetical protein OG399_44430 [Streptomyces achromogenes]|uniref:Uncharacterized protein n=1 Tax=Streptomyces achromogenes TaxID=67255 RepID=A0ABZ1KZB8_STRAH